MLIPFKRLIEKYNIKPTGVLHIGANSGAECKEYYNNGVEQTIWVEPIKEVFEKEVEFNISDNNGESSSMYEFGEHKEMHSNVHFTKKITLKTIRIDSLLKDLTNYEFINLDVQGAELNCLKSMGTLLNQINYVYCEVNKTEVYKEIPLFFFFCDFLNYKGFDLKETGQWIKNTKGQDAWTDAFFIRRTF